MDSAMPGWRRSSYCGSHHNCVEIAWRRGAEDITILVRDSKFPGREPLVFTPGEWAAFLARIKAGEFDVLASPAGQHQGTAAAGSSPGV